MEHPAAKKGHNHQVTTPQQMSLAIFADLLPLDKPITDSPVDIGFRRNRVFLDVYNLSIASRRAMDATFFTVAQDSEIRQMYDVDLGYFKWLMKYTSDNRAHLRSTFRDLQKSALEAESIGDSETWGSIPLLGTVAIRGGRVKFEMDARLQKLIKEPGHWNYFSLRVGTNFKSNSARVLYEHLLEYLDVGVTDWLTLDEARRWTDATTKAYDEYKVLKRKILDPAVVQINAVSQIEVKYQTSNVPGSKRVGAVRFYVSQKPAVIEGRQSLMGSKELYDTLRDEFGLSPANFDEIIENKQAWTDDWIRHAIDFTRFNIERGRVTKSVPGFLMNALRNNLRVGTAEKEVATQLALKKAKLETPAAEDNRVAEIRAASVARGDQEMEDLIASGLAEFDRLSMEEREEHIRAFKTSPVAKLAAKREKIVMSSLTENELRTNAFLAQAFGQFMFNSVCKKKPGKDRLTRGAAIAAQ